MTGWLLAILLICPALLVTTAAPASALPDVVPFTGCNEPHAAVVSPVNPQNVVVAECNTIAVSTDFGRTFTLGFQSTTTMPAGLAAGNWGSCGDPALTFDARGRLFWTYLLCGDYAPADGNRDEITIVVAQINPTTGALIGNPVDTTPGTFMDDKQWLVADARPSSPYANNLYMVWSRLGGVNQVMFVRSTDQGATWSAPRAVSAGTDPGFLWPSHIAVAPNGDLYAGYHSDTCGAATAQTFILRDSSGGADLAAGTAVQKSSFAAATTCNVQDAGAAIPNTDFWMQGDQQPWILPDPVRPGNVYVVANDDPDNDFATGDPTNVILARSTNYGSTWSISTISHAPAGTVEVMPTAAIDQDGKIAVFWYDTRRRIMNNNGTAADTSDDYLNLDVFATTSRDGGLTFVNDFRINDAQFAPNQGAPCRFQCNAGDPGPRTLRIGEYNGIAAANGNAYAAWTGNSGGGQGMFFDVFSLDGAFGDRFEPNDSGQPGVPTDLGAHAAYNQPELTVHDELDEDVFRVTALTTGKLTVELSQNARLADLDVEVRDRFNQVVATASAAADSNASERLTWPAVAAQSYLVRVSSQAGQFPAHAVYDLNITNVTAPVPFGIGLEPGSDSGWYDDDDITSSVTPEVTLLVDQDPLEGLALSSSPDATLTDDAPGHKVGVYVNGTLDGFATPAAGPGLYRYTLSGGSVVPGVNAITGRVLIVDPSDGPTAGTDRVVGRGAASSAFLLTVDSAAPAPPSPPDLLDSSDSGPSNSDNVTGISSPAFQGTAEPNTRVRVLADGVNIGEGVVGSDATDGVTGNGLGAWEVTVEPLVDGSYTITAVVEDRAGNISAPSAPMAGGPLVIDTPGNGSPQRPTMRLHELDDTGRASNDDVTRLTALRFIVSGEVGTTMVIKNGNTVIETWTQAAPFDERVLVLPEGRHPLSAESTDAAGNRSAQSEELRLAVDATAPAAPAAPDLLATSDTGGIADDDVTTLRQPQFGGTGEPYALSRLFVDGALIGDATVNSSGAYQATATLLADGVGLFSVQYEDLAGNLSPPSAPLKVTIAAESLRLPGATASGPAASQLVLDLGSGTLDGYPGIAGATGKIGIVGIPAVSFAAGGQSLSVLGSAGDDSLAYAPTSSGGGSLTRSGTAQVLTFADVSALRVDPLAGNDVVTLVATANADQVDIVVDLITTAQANDTLLVSMPTAAVERVATTTGAGADTITVASRDTVSAFVSADAGDPATAPKRPGDLLNVVSLSARPALQNSPGGPTPGSGVATVSYPRTTKHVTRVDYGYVEKTVLTKG